jgi:hypothetical protein
MGQLHLFGTKTQLEVLSNLGDPLIKANQLIGGVLKQVKG